MSEQIKFTKEELESITAIQQDYQAKALAFGQIEIEKLLMNKRIQDLNGLTQTTKDEFIKLQEREAGLAKQLQEKYGPGTLNPQTGEFVPSAEASSD